MLENLSNYCVVAAVVVKVVAAVVVVKVVAAVDGDIGGFVISVIIIIIVIIVVICRWIFELSLWFWNPTQTLEDPWFSGGCGSCLGEDAFTSAAGLCLPETFSRY